MRTTWEKYGYDVNRGPLVIKLNLLHEGLVQLLAGSSQNGVITTTSTGPRQSNIHAFRPNDMEPQRPSHGLFEPVSRASTQHKTWTSTDSIDLWLKKICKATR